MKVRRGDPCVFGDGKPSVANGWCSMHYASWRKYGDPVHPEAEAKRRQKQGSVCSVEGCGRKPSGRGLCSACSRRLANHGETTDSYERRFWAQVDKRGPDECWPWTGHRQPNGYGNFGRTGTRLVHRIAYQFLVGPIPEGLVLDHLCHTRDPECREVNQCPHRRCCNPGHLDPTSRGENIARGNGGDSWGYVPDPLPPKPEPAPKPTVCAEDDGTCGKVYKRDLCVRHYKRWQRDPTRERPAPRTVEQRFWEKVDKDGPVPEHRPKLGACWVWTASINRDTGYGRFGVSHGDMVDAHRFSYLLAHGSIPEKYDVHHECHTRRCIRPDHLVATTRSQNLAMRKDRRQPE